MAKNRDGRNFEGKLVWALHKLNWFFNEMSGGIDEVPPEWDEDIAKVYSIIDEVKERGIESHEPES